MSADTHAFPASLSPFPASSNSSNLAARVRVHEAKDDNNYGIIESLPSKFRRPVVVGHGTARRRRDRGKYSAINPAACSAKGNGK